MQKGFKIFNYCNLFKVIPKENPDIANIYNEC